MSAAAQIALDGDGRCTRIAIGIGAATDFPMRLDAAEQQLTGTTLDEAKVADAVSAALADIEPMADLHASADYRRRVAVDARGPRHRRRLSMRKRELKERRHAH